MGFSAMLAEEYILIDISVSAASWCACLRNINEVYSASAFLFIFSYRAEPTQNISTAESPDRCTQCWHFLKFEYKYTLTGIRQ